MFLLGKTLHVLALGLWFGSVAFFVLVVATSLFSTFDAVGNSTARPEWLPLTKHFVGDDIHINGPAEQGSRLFGAAVGPLFVWFFFVQGMCGFLATTTALGWSRSHPEKKVHRVRMALLLAALITVLAGWPLEHRVAELREPRSQATDAYLDYLEAGAVPPESVLAQMKEARADFARWHLFSLGLSFVTLILVSAAMALAAQLPPDFRPQVSTKDKPEEQTPAAKQ
jgi:hypothetical protein